MPNNNYVKASDKEEEAVQAEAKAEEKKVDSRKAMSGATVANDIALIAKKQIVTSQNFKQPRMVEVLDTEDVYNFKLRPALQGRLNVPFDGVILSGFVDTWVSENNRPVTMMFEDPQGANLKGARKIGAAWERDKKTMKFKAKKLAMKHLAAISGRAIAKYYAESDPKYCPYLQIVDYLDFHCEPNGGGHLDDHYFHWQENIFRSKDDLIDGGRSGWYDKDQVTKLIASYDSPDFKKNEDTFNNKNARYMSLGLDMQSNNYIGGTLYNLVEGDTYYKGKKYHVILEKNTNIWLRCVLLAEDFGNDLTPFLSFAAPKADAFNFWNRGPADQIKPIAEAIRLNLNEVLNNNRKRNWDMKAVDMNMFPDLRKLDWRQDGVIHANVPLNQTIQAGIYKFETPELSGALNLNAYLNNLAGEKLGITAATQGDANESKVGIYQGNQMQIGKRMKLSADAEEEFHEDLGKRYDWGLWDHASEEEMVRLLSTEGIGWEKITKEDKDPDYVVVVNTSEDEKVQDDQVMRVQLEALTATENNKVLFSLVNPKAHLEEKYKLMGFKEDTVKKLMDTKSDTTDELISDARKAIEMILEGKKPGMNWGATTDYLQYISDWILDNSDDLKPADKAKIEAYFEAHLPVAQKNAEQKQFRDELLLKQKQAEALLEDPKTAGAVAVGDSPSPLPEIPANPTMA